MSNPTELPDLYKLEALARAATPGPWSRNDSHGKVYIEPLGDNEPVAAITKTNCASNAAFIAAANPAAVLALIALARRAKPEGEAPQVETLALSALKEIETIHNSMAALIAHEALFKIECLKLAQERAATLSPLCGAQHAESGKEAAVFANDGAEPDWSSYAAAEATPCPYCGSKDGQHDRAYPHPRAAQQAAAPGADAGGRTLDAEATRAIRRAVRYLEENDCTGPAADLKALLDAPAAPSAPGTPEAPKQPAHGHRDDYYLLANGRRLGLESISRVRNMPNWVLAMELFATGSTSAHQICIDAGIDPDSYKVERAAQLDGGQEGSAT